MKHALLISLVATWVLSPSPVGTTVTFGSSALAPPNRLQDSAGQPFFPRLMGMNIGAKHYDDPEYQKQLARLDVVILGFYKGWKPSYGMAKVVRNLKELSGGRILVGQYTVLNECGDDPKNAANLDIQTKINAMNWWARKTDGSRVQWTAQYRAWDINFTARSKPGANGQRFPQWLAERDDGVYFKPVPFDLWYCDNVFGKPRVTADWDGDGKDDSPKDPIAAAAYRAGHCAEWDHIRKIHPGLPLVGNADSDLSEPEYAGQLEGAFLEGLMGKSWSIEKWGGWSAAMKRYRDAMANTQKPHLVGFNVHGDTTNYCFFRYAYTSCLLYDGYFCFTDDRKEYSSVTWFDEFDFRLGAAITKPPTNAWQNGVWRRDFERGISLVNPTKQTVSVAVEPGFRRLLGKQDPAVNDGKPATSIVLEAKGGIILRREQRAAAEPVRIIFDTDMDSDCDDAGALAILHTLANRGEANIAATVVSSLYRWNVPCLETINRYFGCPDLPIGAPKCNAVDSHAGSKYARQIAETGPVRLKSNADAPDATAIYRQTLAAQPDRSVVILTVGEVTNIRNLLRSPADQHSPLAGPELIKRKVKRWVCMGGRYPRHLDPKVFGNFKTDPAAIVEAARDWPLEVVFCGLGDDILTGTRLKETPADNPVRRAYELYLGTAPARPSWDLIATLYAVRPEAQFWRLRDDGYNHIFPNGTNEWRDQPDSPTHRLLLLADGAEEQLKTALEELMIQPPRRR